MPSSKRLIRRPPLSQRIKSYLNPADFMLWISEEIEGGDWEPWLKEWAAPLGVFINLAMLIARANSGFSSVGDGVFEEEVRQSTFTAWLATFIVHLLSFFSSLNAVYTFYRTRHYRLFEAPVDEPLSTPSARRVRVDSSPVASSPLRFLQRILAEESAESRAHPDASKHVWELSVWDPMPFCLSMFCSFSPGHVLIYWMLLPTTSKDMRPSATVMMTILFASLLSIQLLVLQKSFSQQSRDMSLIHKEVLSEYDIKYVHPRTQPLMRDVGTQFSGSGFKAGKDSKVADDVVECRPVTVVNKGFRTKPNPNYISHFDPDASQVRETPTRTSTHAQVNRLIPSSRVPVAARDFSSPLEQRTALRHNHYRASIDGAGGDGGNFGVYSHAHSPLKKAASTHFAPNQRINHIQSSPRRESGRL